MTEVIRSATIIGGSVAGASYAALFLARGVAIRINGRSTQPPILAIPAKMIRKARLLPLPTCFIEAIFGRTEE